MLTENDKLHLEERIAEAERLTKAQIVMATVERSDSYAEIPWKAFAMGASFTGLLVFSLDLILFSWIQNTTVLISVVTILALASYTVVMTILFPGFARFFLTKGRAEAETRQYAESLFLSKELFSTARRTGILVLVSRFERKVVIVPDKRLSEHVTTDDMKSIIGLMRKPLARNEFRQAFDIAADEIIRIIKPLAIDEPASNELSDEIIEEKGV